MKQDSRLEKEKGKDSRRRGEGLPFRVGTPAPFPTDPSLPTANTGSRGMSRGMSLSECWALDLLCHLRDPGVSLER